MLPGLQDEKLTEFKLTAFRLTQS